MSLDTLVVSARPKKSDTACNLDPIVPPIYHSTIYRFDSVSDYCRADENHEPMYSRDCNPTTSYAEHVINVMEGGQGCLLFNSGLAAISTTLLCILKTGDHIIIQKPTYFGVEMFVTSVLANMGVSVSHVTAGAPVQDYRLQIQPNTKLLYGETPCNPNMTILDLDEFGKLGQETGILTFVDGTFASPYLQQPIRYGVDVSMHSCTKYVGGHSDVLAGCITTRTKELYDRIIETRTYMGTILNPHTASLLLRGLKTLGVRAKTHSHNAARVAQFLENHPKVILVAYPGLTSHPQHVTARKQMRDFGGMIMFEVKGGRKAAITVLEAVRIINLAVSLGGVQSGMEHPASMSRGTSAYKTTLGDSDVKQSVAPGCIRLSVGIEDPDDLICDLNQALSKVHE